MFDLRYVDFILWSERKYIFSLAEQREDEDTCQINVVIDKSLHPVLELYSTSHKGIHVIKSELEPSVSLLVRISFLTTVEMAHVVTLWPSAAVQRQRSHTVECHQCKDASTGSDSVLNLQVWPLLLFIVFYLSKIFFSFLYITGPILTGPGSSQRVLNGS